MLALLDTSAETNILTANPEDEVTAFRISYKILLDILDILRPYPTRNRACLEQSSLTRKLHFPRTIILFDLIPKVCNIFVDNIPVRGPETIYNNEEALPRIRRYIFEYLISLNKVLVNIKLASCTIARKKS
ncbi:hypothetical protein L249_6003 [Ophiocordyceps polyrhachis-furcata BCC 54312]|uniref:Uncharacterized protein n=1 Tax=Ophiocordyceps polyrhachis-furcata BCC 54312 TaxID=1330021 RepID=A0A367LIW8_9HYPO|nr:hypothetical protein L249_6003 [Ophiocordyceps polyrhachis-furcata BCC 54312]